MTNIAFNRNRVATVQVKIIPVLYTPLFYNTYDLSRGDLLLSTRKILFSHNMISKLSVS